MQVNEYEFETVLLQIKAAIEPEQLRYMRLSGQPDYVHRSYVVHAIRNFASSRCSDAYEESTEYTKITSADKTPLNYLRLLVVGFCPDLDFGWLSPTYRTMSVPYAIHKHIKSWNLYPLTDDDFRGQFGRKWRVAKTTNLDAVQWLTECRPLTANARHVNMTNSYEVCDDYRDSLNDRYPRR
jgi:hypothetical protein